MKLQKFKIRVKKLWNCGDIIRSKISTRRLNYTRMTFLSYNNFVHLKYKTYAYLLWQYRLWSFMFDSLIYFEMEWWANFYKINFFNHDLFIWNVPIIKKSTFSEKIEPEIFIGTCFLLKYFKIRCWRSKFL